MSQFLVYGLVSIIVSSLAKDMNVYVVVANHLPNRHYGSYEGWA